jgi:Flp pilus assembly protein TadG
MLSILRHPSAALRRHIATRSRGQSLVELALILPVFMLFFAAVLDLGRIAGAQIAVQNAAREGAFQAAQTPTDFNSTLPCPADGLTNKIYCRIKLESSGGVAIAATDVSVNCNPVSCATGIGNTVTVRVNGHFRLLTPLMAVFFGGNQNVTFTGSAVYNRETLPATGLATAAPTATATATATSTSTATATATSTATATLPPVCNLPSAGFTYTVTGSPSHQAPQTITVVDTSTSINCGITSWIWTWGDGTTGSGQIPGSHRYIAPNINGSGYFTVSLQVTNAAGSTTFGGVQIQVK